MTDQARLLDVRTPDGGAIRARSVGQGPVVVLLHGGGVRGQDYRRFAAALASRCTVVTYDRRPAAVQGSTDGEVVLDDLRAVLAATGATRLFGHSIGGFLALDAGDRPRAMAIAGQGLRASGRASDLPFPVQLALARLFLRTPIGRRMGEGLPEVVREDRLAIEAAGPASAYAGIPARLLLAYGGRSPAYYRPTCERIAAAVPGARSLRIGRGSHNAPNVARPWFTAPFTNFFATG